VVNLTGCSVRTQQGLCEEFAMKSVVFDRFGTADEVLQVRDLPVPDPNPGQVLVRMIASPINPSDLMYIRGEYGRKPTLPASAGFEGVGKVEASGGGFLGWRVRGRRVAVLNSAGGNWSEQVVIPSRQAVPIPDNVGDEQAATFFVNPASALVMTRYVLKIPHGAWLLQTAAGGALGRIVVRLGKLYGFKTVNIVRRQEQADELKRMGADAVIVSKEGKWSEEVRSLTKGGVGYALDAVGGDTGVESVASLGSGGRLLVYGTLSEEPMTLSPRLLMVGNKKVGGFWLSEWTSQQNPLTMLRLFRQVARLFQENIATTAIQASYPLEDIRTAVQQAAAPGRSGKILLRMGGSGSAAG
jgi:NADPH:quinone reductase-like Zn-dependent oxidoreductase